MKIFEFFNDTQTTIERDYTAEELEQYNKDQKELADLQAAKLAEETQKAAKRTELLSRLGITEEEARILLG